MNTLDEKKLELKYLAPYLPYDIEVINSVGEKVKYFGKFALTANKSCNLKLVLKPINDVTIEIAREFYSDLQEETVKSIVEDVTKEEVKYLSYYFVQFLISKHFDVFGLIEKGLAVNINTLK